MPTDVDALTTTCLAVAKQTELFWLWRMERTFSHALTHAPKRNKKTTTTSRGRIDEAPPILDDDDVLFLFSIARFIDMTVTHYLKLDNEFSLLQLVQPKVVEILFLESPSSRGATLAGYYQGSTWLSKRDISPTGGV